MPFRICYVVPGFPAGESDWFLPAVSETILAMAERYEVYVVTLRYPGRQMDYRIKGVPVSALANGPVGSVKSGVGCIKAEYRLKPFDLIHSFWGTTPGLTGAIAALQLGLPLVLTCAGGEIVDRKDISYGDWQRFIPRLFVKASLRFADRIIVGSAYQYNLLTKRNTAGVKKALSIPLGIDTQGYRPVKSGLNRDEIKILHVAGLVPVKNQRLLLQAMARIADRPWRLEIVGDGYLKKDLQALSSSLGIDSRIDWRGWVHHDKMVVCYQNADLFLLTSEHEAQGVVLLEAMACGLPVVATEVGLAPELIDADVCVPRGDEQTLANAIAGFLDHPHKRLETGLRNREIAQRYDMKLSVDRLADVYEHIIGDDSHPLDG